MRKWSITACSADYNEQNIDVQLYEQLYEVFKCSSDLKRFIKSCQSLQNSTVDTVIDT